MDDTDSSDSWDFQDEDGPCFSSNGSNSVIPSRGASMCGAEGSTSNQSRSKAISHFTEMGFSEDLVIKTVDEKGEENTEAILETLLAYTAPEECASQGEPVLSHSSSPEFEWDSLDDLSDFSDAESCLQNEESVPETKMMQLVAMGFSIGEVSAAINSSDPDTSIADLMDFISAAQMAEPTSDHPRELPLEGRGPPDVKKKKLVKQEFHRGREIRAWRSSRKEEMEKRKRYLSPVEDDFIKIPQLMNGFGVPGHPRIGFKRKLPDVAIGPPYFYFENVALAPKGAWSSISRSLFNIEPEFVDSKYFCAAARKRGYIHNLPTDNRFPLLPIPPLTIAEALPLSSRWWPSWDVRKQFNCLLTCYGSALETERIRKDLEGWQGDPPEHIQKRVLNKCRKWNFVWTAKNSVAPLLPEEVELMLGYPRNHTRGGATSQAERYKSLGNSFQVNTVAFHLSVLKNRYPNGISVLSLFSGIGGAEIALHQLGIPLRFVVAVEISEVSRNIFRGWWENTDQKGILIDNINDVTMLTANKIEKLVDYSGGFDLVIGGSPCNNLTGSNRWHRDGLDGKQSVLFYDYCRVLNTVKRLVREN
ncbi:DNA (cytosine-5)-methyltransferase DRM2-like [Papaver somniferum]|uniref:DNA (cytosine-5)-methyltransferase DRM2-like n=1 Tax=Papaver somniferum TaxID=3469 RepID=UPI000E6FC11C|nr:DNA (cytosine-5)-methyltransferase DRM2-like [Papaver somniferum]XP_026408921.1 DNA (cytosine-5)-methyltransferase DRM2-like [Papaver somniferum]XP_026408922.1 DNA (cytosine-5)-methyltransferase DRM2-like [Papaver somniferum]